MNDYARVIWFMGCEW